MADADASRLLLRVVDEFGQGAKRRVAANDQVIEQDGVKLVIDESSLAFVDGTEIDFARQGLNSAFVFRNPNVTGECGCGESFTVG